jgi:2-hydroxychromene-2-carboxylate isomerase
MAEKFKEQGGAATMDPSPMVRWITSRVMRKLVHPDGVTSRREAAERARKKRDGRHRIEYFHQVDDGYSHLAVQALQSLLERYDVELECFLVSGPDGANLPEPDLLARLGLRDAAQVSNHYGVDFPPEALLPSPGLVATANAILCQVSAGAFAQIAIAVGEAIYSAEAKQRLDDLAHTHGAATSEQSRVTVFRGDRRLAELKHYSGAMFYYAGEWYWGIDRLYHLEQRLRSLGVSKASEADLLFPRPAVEMGPGKDSGKLTLEVYASLRSPYTAVIFDTAVQLAKDTGVSLALRPVLPMVMRGVSLTRQKGLYIFADAAREAHALGQDFGKIYDPIGSPVRRCYSLYSWARAQGKEVDLLGCFLRAVFSEGINTNKDEGLKKVVEAAGLDWAQATTVIDNDDWQEELEANRMAMYGFDCWGVPTFRLLDESGATLVSAWGQDRLWLVSRSIQQAIAAR